MAGGPLQFALQKLDSLLVKEQQLLRGVDTGVKDIRDELECIKSFLREADAREDRGGMRTWVNQVREIAYDIEDVLDEFMLHFNQPHGHGFAGFLHRGIHYIKHLGTRHRIATDNDCGSRVLITTRIRDVGLSCLETCGLVYNLQPLPPAKAWSLFCKKAFRSIPGGACPPELQDISHDIVKLCDGLPLAIVAIAGLLMKYIEIGKLQMKTRKDRTGSFIEAAA